MKYVAFLDILGFKEKLKKLNQNEACEYISSFANTATQTWDNVNNSNLCGTIVSDSFIIYTTDTSAESLTQLICCIDDLCKNEFMNHGILIRGAMAKGNFDTIPTMSLEATNLDRNLIVGQAYVDAYLLEGAVKTTGIVLSDDCYEDYKNAGMLSDVFDESMEGKIFHIYRYLSLDFLQENDNMALYINLARESRWLPHYYNALYMAFRRESNDKKIQQVFDNIFVLLENGSSSEHWRDVDLFIKNSFTDKVNSDYQVRFLKYLRTSIKAKTDSDKKNNEM